MVAGEVMRGDVVVVAVAEVAVGEGVVVMVVVGVVSLITLIRRISS